RAGRSRGTRSRRGAAGSSSRERRTPRGRTRRRAGTAACGRASGIDSEAVAERATRGPVDAELRAVDILPHGYFDEHLEVERRARAEREVQPGGEAFAAGIGEPARGRAVALLVVVAQGRVEAHERPGVGLEPEPVADGELADEAIAERMIVAVGVEGEALHRREVEAPAARLVGRTEADRGIERTLADLPLRREA